MCLGGVSIGHRKIVASGVDSNGDPFPGRFVLGFSGGRFSFLVSQDYSIGDIKTLAYQPSPLPSGWLPCDGRSLSRTTYSDLFTVLSTTYGNVDDDTFNLPDLSGRVVAGKGTTDSFSAVGKTGGVETHTLTEEEMPSHDHFLISDTLKESSPGTLTATSYIARQLKYPSTSSNFNLNYALVATSRLADPPIPTNFVGKSSATGGDKAHTNLQPYIVMYHIIYTGITS